MTAIFSNVVVDIDKDLKNKFPSDFDYGAMVEKLVDHAGLKMITSENGDSKDISLHGSWMNMTQVYTLLTTALRMYGATVVPKGDLEPQAMMVISKSEDIMPVVEDKVDSESDNELNTMADDTEDYEYDTPDNDTVQTLPTQPHVLNTQPDSVAAAIMESCVLGDRKIHSAYVLLDEKICKDGVDAANDSDHKNKQRPRKRATVPYNMSNDKKDGTISTDSETVQSLLVKPSVPTAQLDTVASPVTKNTERASILANGDGIMHDSACEEAIDHTDMGTEMKVENDSDPKIKKKRGRPRKLVTVYKKDTCDVLDMEMCEEGSDHTDMGTEMLAANDSDHKIKKKRGRPRKLVTVSSNDKKDTCDVLDTETCEEGSDHVDMGTEMKVENDSDHTTIKKKQGLLVNEKRGWSTLPTDPTLHLESKHKPNSRPGKRSGHDGKPDGRGRPRTFPVGEQPCDKCDFVGKHRNALNAHRQIMHFGIQTKCDVCDKVFPNRRYMVSHKVSHSIRQHCCDVCGKIYKIMKQMLEHKKTHEEDFVRSCFPCEFCSKTYTYKATLKSHVKTEHLGEKKNAHLCSICGNSFTTKTALQEHFDAHNGLKPNVCEVCGKCFSYKSSLRLHKSIHVAKQYICEICSKEFSQRAGLSNHMKTHAVKQYMCNDCGAKFTQRHSLQIHERAHKGDRPFICKLCWRDFGDISVIRRHLKLIHKIHKEAKTWREDIMVLSNLPDTSSFPVSQSKQIPTDDNKKELTVDGLQV